MRISLVRLAEAQGYGNAGELSPARERAPASRRASAKLAQRLSLPEGGRVVKLVLLVLGCSLVAVLTVVGVWAWAPDRDRTDLEARYLNDPRDYVDVAGVRLHVRDTGAASAPAIVLLPGFGSSLQTWDDWARVLSMDHRVIRLDLPGSGLSGLDPQGDYSDARTLTILEALLDRLGVRQAAFVGNSLGGRLAWKFAATRPQRVDALILISPDGFASPGFEYGKAPEIPASLKLMEYFLPKRLLRMSLAPAYGDPSRLSEPVVDRYYDLLRAPGARAAMLARMHQSLLVDPAPLLACIQAPTLLLWGEKDRMIPFSNAADYLHAIRGSRLVAFPDLGHVPQEEAPATSLAPVLKFLRERSA
jgi:pimeloyl-ACP methyl ester carboxylesterase